MYVLFMGIFNSIDDAGVQAAIAIPFYLTWQDLSGDVEGGEWGS